MDPLRRFFHSPHVPHLLQLPLYPEPFVRHRKREKGKPTQGESGPSWTSSWARFIRGNIPSEHSAQIIKRFLSLMVPRAGANAQDSDNEAESGIDEIEGHGAQPVKLNMDGIHKILRDDANRLKNTGGVRARWSSDCANMQRDSIWDSSGNNPTMKTEEYKAAANAIKRAQEEKAPRSAFLSSYPFIIVNT